MEFIATHRAPMKALLEIFLAGGLRYDPATDQAVVGTRYPGEHIRYPGGHVMTGAGQSGRSAHGAVAGAVVDLVLPLAVYYGLRAAGVGVYLALLGGALACAAGAAVTLATTRRVTGMTGYVLTMMLLSTGVALLVGSPRFLLAREGWVTGVTGLWFIASLAAHRPLAYLFSRPLLEGRFRWPSSWDELWDRSPRFRRMWRISSVLWGIGTLADSVVRVAMAYTLPVDLVPALGTALYAGTSAVIIVVTNIYYITAGVYDRGSAMYGPVETASRH